MNWSLKFLKQFIYWVNGISKHRTIYIRVNLIPIAIQVQIRIELACHFAFKHFESAKHHLLMKFRVECISRIAIAAYRLRING